MSYDSNAHYYNNHKYDVLIIVITIGVFYGLIFLGLLAVCLCGRRKVYPGHVIRKEEATGPSMIMVASYGNAGVSMGTSSVNPTQSTAFQNVGQQQQQYPQAVSGYPSPQEAPLYQQKMAQ